MRRWQTFSLFALSELVCTKNVFYPILLFPLLSHPKLLPLWSVPDGQKDGQISTPPITLVLFFPTECAGPYPQAQLYWAGRTMGWMANWTRGVIKISWKFGKIKLTRTHPLNFTGFSTSMMSMVTQWLIFQKTHKMWSPGGYDFSSLASQISSL